MNTATGPRPTATTPGFWLGLVAALVAVKATIYLVDSRIGFVLHDSESYLRTALSGWIPPDRSWLYGTLVGWVSEHGGQLQNLLITQTLAGVASCLLLVLILTRFMGCSRRIAATAALVCAVAPMQLLYERYVMAESFSLVAFGLFVVVLLSFLRRGGIALLVTAIALGCLAGALRVAYLPTAAGLTGLAVLYHALWVRQPDATPTRSFRLRRAGALLLVMVATFGLFVALERAPRQVSDGGGFLLSAWSPLLAREPFASDPRLSGLIDADRCPLSWDNRARQHWDDGCLLARIRARFNEADRGDPAGANTHARQQANRFARGIAIELLLAFPLDVARLGLRNWQTLWDPDTLRAVLTVDSGGGRDMSPSFIDMMQQQFGLDVRGRDQAMPPTRVWFSHAELWYRWVLISPLLLTVWGLLALRHGNPAPMVIAAASVLLLLVITLPGAAPSMRLYHGVAWLSLIGLADGIDRLLRQRRDHRPPAAVPGPTPPTTGP